MSTTGIQQDTTSTILHSGFSSCEDTCHQASVKAITNNFAAISTGKPCTCAKICQAPCHHCNPYPIACAHSPLHCNHFLLQHLHPHNQLPTGKMCVYIYIKDLISLWAMPVLDNETAHFLNYHELCNHPKFSEVWN